MVDVRKFVEWVLGAGVQHSSLHPGTAWDLVDRGQGSNGDIDRGALQFVHTCTPGLLEGLVRWHTYVAVAGQACSRRSRE